MVRKRLGAPSRLAHRLYFACGHSPFRPFLTIRGATEDALATQVYFPPPASRCAQIGQSLSNSGPEEKWNRVSKKRNLRHQAAYYTCREKFDLSPMMSQYQQFNATEQPAGTYNCQQLSKQAGGWQSRGCAWLNLQFCLSHSIWQNISTRQEGKVAANHLIGLVTGLVAM